MRSEIPAKRWAYRQTQTDKQTNSQTVVTGNLVDNYYRLALETHSIGRK